MNVGYEGEMGYVIPVLVWILFILCSIFIMIIMLNLLIAIISEAFARIYSVSAQAIYHEKACLISENSYLIPDSKKEEFLGHNKYLLIAEDAESVSMESKDDMDIKLEAQLANIKGLFSALE